MRRTAIHLLVRLTIAATCTSSAAAFDATHMSRMTAATVAGTHSPDPEPVSHFRSVGAQ